VTELAYEHMNNPEIIRIVSDNVTADKITETAYYVANEEKFALLLGLLRKYESKRAIVFVNTKRVAERITEQLTHNAIHCEMLSGDVPQKKRQSLIKSFAEGGFPVLVATDVAARGLHIPDVTHVFNFDLPQEPEEYVHRVGRTARIGAGGAAISFACEEYAYHLPDIELYIERKIPSEPVVAELLGKTKELPTSRHPSHRRPPPRQRSHRPSDQRSNTHNTERKPGGKKP
jgi:ATP-dependent RNA helicase RhlB